MSLSSVISSIKIHVDNAYNAIDEKHGTIPENKNIENLHDAISTIDTRDGYARFIEGLQMDYLEDADVKFIPSYAFAGKKITTVSFPNASYVYRCGFASNSNNTYAQISNVYLNNCYFMESSAFYSNRYLSQIYAPMCSRINAPNNQAVTFLGCQDLSFISMPYLLEVGASAFSGCYNLDNVSLPKCERIETCAFNSCSSLANLYIPQVSLISNNAFTNCNSLTFLNCPNTTMITDSVFYNCKNLQAISLPVVSYIGNSAFRDCSGLETVSLPTGMAGIFTQAFAGCTRLSQVFLFNASTLNIQNDGLMSTPMSNSSYLGYYGSIYIPSIALSRNTSSPYYSRMAALEGLDPTYSARFIYGQEFYNRPSTFTEIPSEKTNAEVVCMSAFQGCGYLSQVSLPNCEYIHENAFANCNRIDSIYLPKVKYIGTSAFYSLRTNTTSMASGLSFIDLPECENIGNGAFSQPYGFPTLKSINMPKVKYIGAYAFNGCYLEGPLNLPEVIQIGTSAFNYRTGITALNASKCEYIKSGAFFGCSNLTEVNTPNLLWLDDQVFYSCRALRSVSMPNLIMCASNGTFMSCIHLETINLPKCTYLATSTFYSCTMLSQAILPECRYIGYYNFYDCDLKFAYIPKCSYIGSNAFYWCESLESVYLFGSSVASLPYTNAFGNTPIANSAYLSGSYGSIYVPASLVSQYQVAANWSTYSNRFVGLTQDEMTAIKNQYED